MTSLEQEIITLIEQQIELVSHTAFIEMTSDQLREYDERRCKILSRLDQLGNSRPSMSETYKP